MSCSLVSSTRKPMPTQPMSTGARTGTATIWKGSPPMISIWRAWLVPARA